MPRHRPSFRLSPNTHFSIAIADDDRFLLNDVDTTVVKMATLLRESRLIVGGPRPKSIRLLKKTLEDADKLRPSLEIKQAVASKSVTERFFDRAEDALGGVKNPFQKAAGLGGRGLNALADRGLLGETDLDFEEASIKVLRSPCKQLRMGVESANCQVARVLSSHITAWHG